jgi:hypothetical protein
MLRSVALQCRMELPTQLSLVASSANFSLLKCHAWYRHDWTSSDMSVRCDRMSNGMSDFRLACCASLAASDNMKLMLKYLMASMGLMADHPC